MIADPLWLSNLAINAALVLAAGLLAAWGARRRSAALQHALLASAVVAALVVPLLVRIAPVVPVRATLSSAQQVSADIPAATAVSVTTGIDMAPSGDVIGSHRGAVGPQMIVPAAVVVWMVGAAVLLTRLLTGLARLTWIAHQARPSGSARLANILDRVRTSTSLGGIRLLETRWTPLLVAWGWRRPTILIPHDAAQTWTDERAWIVLRHEAAHLRRGDWLPLLAAEVLRALHWFNPLAWIACRRLRDASERACDDEVITAGLPGDVYATHLVDLARTLHAGRDPLPATAMARRSSLEGRISAMLNTAADRRPLSSRTRAAVLATLLAIALPISGIAWQTQFFSFTGLVVDATNGFIPGVRLTLTNNASGAKYEVRTDAAGRFEFVGVPAAEYTLEARQLGFASLRDDRLVVSGNADRTLELQVGSLEETVTIAGSRDTGSRDQTDVTGPEMTRAVSLLETTAKQVAERCGAGAVTRAMGGNIMAPRMVLRVNPMYPGHLQQAGIQGSVVLDARIGADGRVQELRAVNDPHPELEQATIAAVRQWEFTPTYLNCTPVEVRMRVTANFGIRG